jgi:tRNA (guanosine-2'-O-)-methyltransferase
VKQLRRKVEIRRFLESNPVNNIRLAFWMQDWSDAYNVGGMCRVADACGADRLYASGKTPIPPDPMIGVTSMGAHRRLLIERFERHDDCIAAIREQGFALIAVEVTDGSIPYQHFEYPERTCLVLGAEGGGVYGKVLKQCDGSVFIPMVGKGRSINVHVAAAVVGFAARTQQKASPDETGEAEIRED